MITKCKMFLSVATVAMISSSALAMPIANLRKGLPQRQNFLAGLVQTIEDTTGTILSEQEVLAIDAQVTAGTEARPPIHQVTAGTEAIPILYSGEKLSSENDRVTDWYVCWGGNMGAALIATDTFGCINPETGRTFTIRPIQVRERAGSPDHPLSSSFNGIDIGTLASVILVKHEHGANSHFLNIGEVPQAYKMINDHDVTGYQVGASISALGGVYGHYVREDEILTLFGWQIGAGLKIFQSDIQIMPKN